MALIQCIECGNNISNLAKACPFCGCPAEHQNAESIVIESSKEPVIIPLKNYEEWNKVFAKVKAGGWFDAQKDIIKFAKAQLWQASEIVEQMEKVSELPVDFIIDKIPSQKAQPTTCSCKACNKIISVKAEKCPHCGEPTGVRVCPRCGSTDVVILDAVSKAVSMALFGAFSVNTVRSKYECWTCHFKF